MVFLINAFIDRFFVEMTFLLFISKLLTIKKVFISLSTSKVVIILSSTLTIILFSTYENNFALKKKYDYPHGTGHGVGNYLSVHEGPITISKKSTTKFKKGMILTNEPGFYKINEYGIRIENVLLVIKKNKFLFLCLHSILKAQGNLL